MRLLFHWHRAKFSNTTVRYPPVGYVPTLNDFIEHMSTPENWANDFCYYSAITKEADEKIFVLTKRGCWWSMLLR